MVYESHNKTRSFLGELLLQLQSNNELIIPLSTKCYHPNMSNRSDTSEKDKEIAVVSPNKGRVDTGSSDNDLKKQLEEKEKIIKDLELKLDTRNKEMKELKNENEDKQAFSELQKDCSGLQMKHAVLKLEQQVKLQFRFELVTACIHIFSLVVCMLAFCQGWFKMHLDDMSSKNWWSWWYSEVLEGLSGETFYVCVLCLNLLLALFKFIFVYLIST